MRPSLARLVELDSTCLEASKIAPLAPSIANWRCHQVKAPPVYDTEGRKRRLAFWHRLCVLDQDNLLVQENCLVALYFLAA